MNEVNSSNFKIISRCRLSNPGASFSCCTENSKYKFIKYM